MTAAIEDRVFRSKIIVCSTAPDGVIIRSYGWNAIPGGFLTLECLDPECKTRFGWISDHKNRLLVDRPRLNYCPGCGKSIAGVEVPQTFNLSESNWGPATERIAFMTQAGEVSLDLPEGECNQPIMEVFSGYYVTGHFTEDERPTIEKHISSCAYCAEFVRRQRLILCGAGEEIFN